jgi:ribosomal protein S18 acetylase RimI-like enzyme
MPTTGLPTIEIRSVSGYEGLERLVVARNEVLPDDPESAVMMALVRASEAEHVDLIAVEAGEIVGTGMLAGDPNSVESTHPYVEVTVAHRHRGRGVGTALLRELSEHVRRLGKDGVQCEARANDAYSIGYLQRRGFVEIGRLDQVALELGAAERVPPTPPAGIEIRWLAERPDLIEGMYAVAVETYPSLGGHVAKHAETPAEWRLYELGDPRLLLDLAPIAVADDEVVGFSIALAMPDGETAVHRMTTVLPAHRELVAPCLLDALAAAAKEAGLRELLAWPRTDELRHLHARLGYVPRTATIAFQGALL